MCSPTLVLGAQAAGAASSTVGGFYAAQSQRSQLGLQADLAEINARTMERQAQGALAAGQREVQRTQLGAAQLKGRQRAAIAANGVALDSGSPQNVLTTTDLMGEIDANTIDANAIGTAWGYRMQGVNDRNQAAMARRQAGAINPLMSAASTLLGSAGSVASSWYRFKQAGAFDGAKVTAPADTVSTWAF